MVVVLLDSPTGDNPGWKMGTNRRSGVNSVTNRRPGANSGTNGRLVSEARFCFTVLCGDTQTLLHKYHQLLKVMIGALKVKLFNVCRVSCCTVLCVDTQDPPACKNINTWQK